MKEINLPKLIITVFIISWLGVLPSLLIAHGMEIPSVFKSFTILMTLGPLLGAVIFIYRAKGKKGLKDFFKRLLYFKATAPLILVAVVLPILFSYLGAKIGLSLSGEFWPVQFDPSTIVSNGLMIFVMYLIVNTEELAWRGLVFDRLFNKHGFLKACLILAPIWWLFHIPLFLFPGGHQAGYGLLEFTFIVLSQTFILGWIYINSNRSLAYVHLHHQLINGFAQAFPIFPIFIAGNLMPVRVLCGLMCIVALILIIGSRSRDSK